MGNNFESSVDELWYIDSGATQHMTFCNKFMDNYVTMAPIDIFMADNRVVQAIGKGDIVVQVHTEMV